jgi:uncharacterized membrane protein YuzA (DUF378 family)
VKGLVSFVGLGLVVGLVASYVGLFRSNRMAVYIVIGVAVFVSVFVVQFRQNLKKMKERRRPWFDGLTTP